MVELPLGEVVSAIDGQLVRTAAAEAPACGVSIDSRTTSQGQIFFAIVGERMDGHAFVGEATRAGAALIVVDRELPEPDLGAVPVVRVDDTTKALGRLARHWRNRVDPIVVGITGSLGKTTTKELTQQILRLQGPTQHNRGNLNNHIGLPLTLLDLAPGTRFAVVEMGMSAPGEIAYLSTLALPDIACITTIAPVHLEQLGSLEAVAAAKAEILAGLAADGLLVMPDDSPLLQREVERYAVPRRLCFGRSSHSEVRLLRVLCQGESGCALELTLRGETLRAHVPLPGAHHAKNAAAAAAIALALGVDPTLIAEGISTVPELGHRSALLQVGRYRLLDDCYNASPVAMNAALETLVQLAGKAPRVALLGEMRELGARSFELHREVGEAAARLNLSLLITVGPVAAALAEGARRGGMPAECVLAVDDVAQAVAALRRRASEGSWVLVKASRGARLEEAIRLLSLQEQQGNLGVGKQGS